MEEVKKNITTFLGILKIGKTGSVIHWDESNFKRAQRWAQYAEEVYKKLRNKPSLVQALNSHINKQPDIDNVGDHVFSSLGNAREMLRLILIQNPHLSSAQFSLILDMYEVDFLSLSKNNNLEVLINDSFKVSHHKGIFKTLSTIKDELSTIINHEDQWKSSENSLSHVSDDQSTTRCVCLEVVGRLLWQDLQNKENETDGNCKYEEYFAKMLKLVISQKEGIEIYLRMVVISIEKDDSIRRNSEILLDPLQLRVLSWIADNCLTRATDDQIEAILCCPSSLLCDVSFVHPMFCRSYLTFLKSFGDRFYGRPSDMFNVSDVTSRCNYRELVQRLKQLIQGPRHISELCERTLRSWIVDPDYDMEIRTASVNFWQVVCQQIGLQDQL